MMTNSTEDSGQLYMMILGSYIVPILFSIIVVVGFIGNILVIFVILINRQMQNTTNILIISLALADLLFIVFCVPFTAVIYANSSSWPLGTTLCKIYQYTIFTTAYCSVYTLVLMSVDRYLAVVHPIRSLTLRNERNTIYAVLAIWLLFLMLNLPLLFYSGVVSESSNMQFCAIKTLISFNESTGAFMGGDKRMGQLYFGLFFIFGYILPVIVICILYGLLINRLLFGHSSAVSQSSEAMRSKRRVTRMVVIVISIFSICWLPIQIVFMFQFFGPDSNSYFFRTIHVLSNCLAYANSMVNPILYAFLSENFQKAFLNVICYFKKNRPITNNDRTTIACHKLSVLQNHEGRCNLNDKHEQPPDLNEDKHCELLPLNNISTEGGN